MTMINNEEEAKITCELLQFSNKQVADCSLEGNGVHGSEKGQLVDLNGSIPLCATTLSLGNNANMLFISEREDRIFSNLVSMNSSEDQKICI